LVLLKADSLDSCIDKVLDPKNPDWKVYALVTAHLHTNAAVAVPRLVHAFETMDDEIKGRIALPLREIRSRPDLSVPVLTALLAHTNDETRFHAAAGLSSFGAAAKPAWNDLVALLSDKSNQVRLFTTNSLRQIDREAAQQLGIH
jgi:HEAT repeat protein